MAVRFNEFIKPRARVKIVVPDSCMVLELANGSDAVVKVPEESFVIADYLVKGVKAGGGTGAEFGVLEYDVLGAHSF